MVIKRGSDLTRLPRGATGFLDYGTEPLPVTDRRAFAAVCYEAARRTGGRILEITPPGVTPNFHTAVIGFDEDTIAVLGHIQLPFLAIAQAPTDGSASVVFVNGWDRVAEMLRSSGVFQLLTSSELDKPLDSFDISGLDRAEHSELAYWKPQTLGELLFNYWD